MDLQDVTVSPDGPPSASRSMGSAFADAARRPRSDRPTTIGAAIGVVMVSVFCVCLPLFALRDVDAGAGLRIPVTGISQGATKASTRLGDVFIFRDGNRFNVFRAESPHLGDPLVWCPAEGVFVSFPHSEAYGPDGSKVAGPGFAALSGVDYEIEDGKLSMNLFGPPSDVAMIGMRPGIFDAAENVLLTGSCVGAVQ